MLRLANISAPLDADAATLTALAAKRLRVP